MDSRLQSREVSSFEDMFLTRETCFSAMFNKSATMNISHCKPEWDHYSEICWGPTPVGFTAKVPCPDDGYLNPNQFATRKCLLNGTWYVNYTLDDKPYTNFHDCFLPEDPSAEDDLKKLVTNKIIFILKSLDEYKKMYLILHVVSIAMLVSAIIVSAAVVFKLRKNRPSTYSYIALTVAAAVLLVNNTVTVSSSAVDDATNVFKCRLAKSLVLITSLIFYECILAYFYMCIVPILQIHIRTMLMKCTIAAAIILAIVLSLSEQLVEMLSCPSRFCGFRTLQSKFHWLTTAPRLMLILCTMCLDNVTMFGVFYLKQPHLQKDCQLRHIRQKACCALVVVIYFLVLEILQVLMHTEAYLHYSELPVEIYLRGYAFVIAIQGIVFTVLMCLLDLEVLAMLGLPVKCKTGVNGSQESDHQTVSMYSLSKQHFTVESNPMCDHEYYNTLDKEVSTGNVCQAEVVFHTARPEDSTETCTRYCDSKLILEL